MLHALDPLPKLRPITQGNLVRIVIGAEPGRDMRQNVLNVRGYAWVCLQLRLLHRQGHTPMGSAVRDRKNQDSWHSESASRPLSVRGQLRGRKRSTGTNSNPTARAPLRIM